MSEVLRDRDRLDCHENDMSTGGALGRRRTRCQRRSLASRTLRKTWAQVAAAVALVAACTACTPGSADLWGATDLPGGDVARGSADPSGHLGPDDLATGISTDRAATPGPATSGTVVRVDPWRDGTADAAPDAPDPAGASDSCIGSVTSPRPDAFRCFAAHAIRDPCFVDPADSSRYLCVPDQGTAWIRLRGVAGVEPNPPGQPDQVFWARLANGAECKGATGAGPEGLPGYGTWAGTCTGGPWATQRLIWRIADGTPSGVDFPLLPTAAGDGHWLAAVETTEGHVERLPVTAAYR